MAYTTGSKHSSRIHISRAMKCIWQTFYISIFSFTEGSNCLLLFMDVRGVKWVEGSDQQKKRELVVKERTNRSCWMMKVIQLISPPLPLMWVYSKIVICHWWCVCLSVLQQPGPSLICSITSWMVLTDGTSRHRPTGDIDTEAWNRRRHECETWMTHEWDLMYETVQGNSISPCQPFIVHNTWIKFHVPYPINQ